MGVNEYFMMPAARYSHIPMTQQQSYRQIHPTVVCNDGINSALNQQLLSDHLPNVITLSRSFTFALPCPLHVKIS